MALTRTAKFTLGFHNQFLFTSWPEPLVWVTRFIVGFTSPDTAPAWRQIFLALWPDKLCSQQCGGTALTSPQGLWWQWGGWWEMAKLWLRTVRPISPAAWLSCCLPGLVSLPTHKCGSAHTHQSSLAKFRVLPGTICRVFFVCLFFFFLKQRRDIFDGEIRSG